jgi:hypothetical protein
MEDMVEFPLELGFGGRWERQAAVFERRNKAGLISKKLG